MADNSEADTPLVDSDDKNVKQRRSAKKVAKDMWGEWKRTVRAVLFELFFGWALTFVFLRFLPFGGYLLASLAAGLAHAVIGSVFSLGFGVSGNPLTIIHATIIHLMDGDLEEGVSKAWYVVKAVLKVLFVIGGSMLGGLSARAVAGGALGAALMPDYRMAGSAVALGVNTILVFALSQAVVVYTSIYTDDGYGSVHMIGLGEFVMSLLSLNLIGAAPNPVYLFGTWIATVESSTNSWTTVSWLALLYFVLAAALVLLAYYLFGRDIFSQKTKMAAKKANISNDIAVLMDRHVDVGEYRSNARPTAGVVHKW